MSSWPKVPVPHRRAAGESHRRGNRHRANPRPGRVGSRRHVNPRVASPRIPEENPLGRAGDAEVDPPGADPVGAPRPPRNRSRQPEPNNPDGGVSPNTAPRAQHSVNERTRPRGRVRFRRRRPANLSNVRPDARKRPIESTVSDSRQRQRSIVPAFEHRPPAEVARSPSNADHSPVGHQDRKTHAKNSSGSWANEMATGHGSPIAERPRNSKKIVAAMRRSPSVRSCNACPRSSTSASCTD